MLHSVQDLEGFAIAASDGDIGHVKDCYFDDARWVIRYLVVNPGVWIANRKVLISPISITKVEWLQRRVPVSITRQQVQHSPDIDTEKPVSRQQEISYLGYYGYQYYWDTGGLWGQGAFPGGALATGMGYTGADAARHSLHADAARNADQATAHAHDDHHLRSFNEVIGYHIHAADGDIGHVQDLLLDEDTWAIRYLVVNTSNWWLGHQVLVSPRSIRGVSWVDGKVTLDLTRQAIQDAPAYDPAQLERGEEVSLYRYYGLAGNRDALEKNRSTNSHRAL